jgi:hypothetical protein
MEKDFLEYLEYLYVTGQVDELLNLVGEKNNEELEDDNEEVTKGGR